MSDPRQGETFLPYGRQMIEDDDVAAVVAALRSPMLTTGPRVAAFENALAVKVDAPHAVSCANGTAALHIAAMALDLRPGDKVIVPSITFVATANAARYMGAEVVFSDVDPETGLMRPSDLEAALHRAGRGVKAVFPVHLNGQPADPPGLRSVAVAAGIAVVEDACHALGASYRRADGGEALVGACHDSDMAVFSFHPVKAIAAGEGGAVTTRNSVFAERLAQARAHGLVRDPKAFETPDMAFDEQGNANPWYYELSAMGFNYRLNDIQSALALSQLAKLDRFIATRRTLADRYVEALAGLGNRVRPVARSAAVSPAWHLAVALIDFASCGKGRGDVMRALQAKAIGTQVHYIPVHRQPYYRHRYGVSDLPGADAYYARCLSLPLFVGMTEADVDRVVAALKDVLN